MRTLLSAILAGLSIASMALAGLPIRPGIPVRWNSGPVRIAVASTVHSPATGAGVDAREPAASTHAAVVEAIHLWGQTGALPFAIEWELTDETQVAAGRTLITFSDPTPFDDGRCDKSKMIACTLLFFNAESGEILHGAIAFNPYKKLSSIGLPGTFDITLLALHEVGHLLGLGHSPLAESVMNALAETDAAGPEAQRFEHHELSRDDMATLAAIYAPGPVASIEGTLRRDGQPVEGAQVTALDRQGRAVFAGLTDAEGKYRLQAGAGQYQLLATAPGAPYQFWTASGGSARQGETIEVAAEQSKSGVDFQLTSGPSVQLETVGRIVDGLYWGEARVAAARGRRHVLAMTRRPEGATGTVAVPGAKVAAQGSPLSFPSAPQLAAQRVDIAADAALGSFMIQYTTSQGAAATPGALRVVPNPLIAKVTVAEGRLTITGTDLAARSAALENWPESLPYPAQWNGASVRVGDRFVPVRAATPTTITADLPEGAAGNVVVVTGAGMESPAVPLQ